VIKAGKDVLSLAHDSKKDVGNIDDEGYRLLRSWVIENSTSFVVDPPRGTKTYGRFLDEKAEGGHRVVAILPTAFKEFIQRYNQFNERALVSGLRDRGVLLTEGEHLKRKVSFGSDNRARCYCVILVDGDCPSHDDSTRHGLPVGQNKAINHQENSSPCPGAPSFLANTSIHMASNGGGNSATSETEEVNPLVGSISSGGSWGTVAEAERKTENINHTNQLSPSFQANNPAPVAAPVPKPPGPNFDFEELAKQFGMTKDEFFKMFASPKPDPRLN